MRKLIFVFAFLLTAGMHVVYAQTTIKGTVTDPSGQAVPGANVVVKGFNDVGSITDLEGKYSLNVPAGATTLVFSFIGMKTAEVEIAGQSVINYAFQSEDVMVDEVVVTALGITREKKSLGYAVQDVKGDEINNAKTGNVLSAITGRMAGVNITSSAGVGGASSYINIRGQNSINGDNQPLFVVDGVPIDNSMEYSGNPDDGVNNLGQGVAYSNRAIDLNPDDIETISVLKGGAATALYGMRAGNGVVIITTKKGGGKNGKTAISFSSSVGLDKVNRLPDMQMIYAQGNGGVYEEYETPNSWGPKISDLRYDGATDSPWDPKGNLVLATDPSARQDLLATAYDNTGNFFRTGITLNNNLAMSGGDQNSNFYISIGNSTSNGIIPRNKYSKTSIKITGETKLGSKVKLTASANYIRSGGTRMQQGSNTSGVMLGLLRGTPSFDNSYGHGKDGYKYEDAYKLQDGSGFPRSYYYGYDNPYWTVNMNQLKDQVDRVIGYASLVYNPIENLTITYRIGDDFYADSRKGHTALYSANIPGGQQEEDYHYRNDLNSDLTINYTKELFTDFSTNITVGQNLFASHKQQVYNQGNDFAGPDFYHLSNTLSQIVREMTEKYRTAALYADIQFSYKNMLYLGFTGRNEWSTTLPEENNSFFFPSASFGFIFSELPFLKDNNILTFGKLRASTAKIANHATPYNVFNTFILAGISDGWATGGSFPFNSVGGFFPNNILGNPTIKPESVVSKEIGMEIRLFKNRIGFDISYYNNQNRDLLINVPITGSTGYNAQYMNAATMENKGIEIMANGSPIRTKDFDWNIAVNFTKNNNKVLSLAEGVDNISLAGFTGTTVNVVVGEAYGSMFSNSFYKDDQGRMIINDNPSSAGYGYPIKDPTMKSLGGVSPKWTMGITNSLTYKGISLSFLIDIKNGGLMWNGTKSRLLGFGTAKETENRGSTKVFEGVKGHLVDGEMVTTGAANDISATLSEYYYKNIGGGSAPAQEQFVEKTDWVRLREVSISYQLGNILKSSFLKQANVFATGRNLWLSTPYDGIDPETSLFGANNAQGIDYFNMPNTKSFVFGLKLDF